METPTEVAWKDEAEKTPTRGIPILFRVLIAACLGWILLLIVGGVWLTRFAGRMVDPREQWASIREVIGVDEPTPSYSVLGIPKLRGMRAWSISDEVRKRHLMLYQIVQADETRRAMLAPDPRELLGTRMDPTASVEKGTIVIQGRELRCMRFRCLDGSDESAVKRGPISIRFGPSDSKGPGEPEPGIRVHGGRSGPAILVELSAPNSEVFLGCMMVTEDPAGRVEDAELVEFLEPFHVGPER